MYKRQLSGKANNLFDPKGNATRAEAATVLHRFVEVIIDPQSAHGWQQNDSGEWSYYKDGEPVKGWLSDAQKWYWLDKACLLYTSWRVAAKIKRNDLRRYPVFSHAGRPIHICSLC